jgi:hypothetical protein
VPDATASPIHRTDAGNGLEGGVSHHATLFQVSNTSTQTCTLTGVPTIHLFGPHHRPAHLPLCPNCGDYLFPAEPVHPVTLKPGAKADFIVGYVLGEIAGETCEHVTHLELQLKGADHPIQFNFFGSPNADSPVCDIDVLPWQPASAKPPAD